VKDICANKHRGAETSVQAYATTPESKRLAMRTHILGFIEASSAFGTTCEEIEERTGLPHQSVSARISELLRDGLIHYGSERRKTRAGKSARVYFHGPAKIKTDLFE